MNSQFAKDEDKGSSSNGNKKIEEEERREVVVEGEEEEEDYVVREIDVYFNAPHDTYENENISKSQNHKEKDSGENNHKINDDMNLDDNDATNNNQGPSSSMKDRDIYIVQFPTKPFFRYVDTPEKSRMKYENKILELDYHINQDGDHFNTDAETFLMVDKCKMRSSFVDTTNSQTTSKA